MSVFLPSGSDHRSLTYERQGVIDDPELGLCSTPAM